MSSAKVAVLGGGLAGLQVGRLLQERGVDCLILEERDVVGGLCRTIRSGRYCWDIGPHAFYSRDPRAMEYYRALPVAYAEHRRNVKVCHRGPGGRIFEVGYPFENGLADLPLRHRLECLAGYCRAFLSDTREYRHLRHWIEAGLGEGIARHFMIPYNEKIWDCPLERISMDLVNRKIDPEPPLRLLRHCFVRGSVGRGYQARFLYPKKGAGALTDAVAETVKDRIRTGWRVSRLEPVGRRWRIVPAQGAPVEADSVVSTIPLPELLKALGDPRLLGYQESFRGNDTYVVAVGLKEACRFGRFGDCHWVFFAGPEVFYRVTLMNSLSDERPPTLVAEITRKGPSSAAGIDGIVGRVLRDLIASGMLPGEHAVDLAQGHLERYTYPIPTLGLARAREAVERRLSGRGIFLAGRSGRWSYINTDGVFLGAEAFVRDRLGEIAGSEG
ncbi:MAG: FAD-dependent oxidoreductase [Elusimicrobiota bacterium]